MGSLIMPHNIYLHSALVQTRRLGSSRPAAKREAMMYFGIESALSLVVGAGWAGTGLRVGLKLIVPGFRTWQLPGRTRSGKEVTRWPSTVARLWCCTAC